MSKGKVVKSTYLVGGAKVEGGGRPRTGPQSSHLFAKRIIQATRNKALFRLGHFVVTRESRTLVLCVSLPPNRLGLWMRHRSLP